MDKFSKLLNYAGAGIILVIFLLFGYWVFSDIKNKKPPEPGSIGLSFSSEKISPRDSTIYFVNKKFIADINAYRDTLNHQIEKLKDLKKDISESESRNSDLFKLLLALIGAVFAIVGFFGFKSINDARESALKNAVTEAKAAAETTAKEIADFESKKIAGEKAKEVATSVAKEVATDKAEKEIKRYLDENFPEYFRKWEEAYVNTLEGQITDLSDKVNKLENPESYGIENKNVKELSEKYLELISIIEQIKLEYLKKK